MIAQSEISNKATGLEALCDQIIAAGHGKEFKTLLNQKMSLDKAVSALKLNHPNLSI